jgi:hypothetical protein
MGDVRRTQNTREGKHERFVRVVERRTNETLERIRVISNCSNRNTYSYSDDEVTAVFAELERALRTARARFKTPGRSRFRLPKERIGKAGG